MGAATLLTLFVILVLITLRLAAAAPSATWTWVGGSQELNQLPNYGQVRSQPAAPGARDTMVTLVTPSGLKLETCGFGPDLSGEIGWLSGTLSFLTKEPR